MAEEFVKPGNQSMGWNDPPVFSYGKQNQINARLRRNHLTRRVPPPQITGEMLAPCTAVAAMPPPTAPPVCSSIASPPAASHGQSESQEPQFDDVWEVLTKLQMKCEGSVPARVTGDITRKLELLKSQWENDKLSPAVKVRMGKLCHALQSECWGEATELQVSLTVDYMGEVSTWVIALRKLISLASCDGE
uniref:Steroid receptor RNA activator 1 n=1 Tax=Eptatretus burgeri TaxID=7764 RepID=A0A8C4WTC6_EPTBU